MKYIILAAIIALLLALLIRRLLPYLRLAKKFIQTLQQLRSGTSAGGASSMRRPQSQEKLVRCSVCGTWVPANRTIGGGGRYCSESCSRQDGRKAPQRAAM